jgi:hypothetical protein
VSILQGHQAQRARLRTEDVRVELARGHLRRLEAEWLEEEAEYWHARAEYWRCRLQHPSRRRAA